MRNKDETEHDKCEDVLGEIQNCNIFYIDICDDEDELEIYISNKNCVDDPLILTIDELETLGKQILKLAEKARNNE